jgi:hypothetical protein
MIQLIKNIFSSKQEIIGEPVKDLTISNCDFLNKSLEEQKEQLIKDGFYSLVYETPAASLSVLEKNGSDRFEDSSLPVHMEYMAKIDASAEERVLVLKPKDHLIKEISNYLETLLLETIAAEVFNNRIEYNKYLKDIEESNYRS